MSHCAHRSLAAPVGILLSLGAAFGPLASGPAAAPPSDDRPAVAAERSSVVGVIRSDNAELPNPVAADQPLTTQQVQDLVRAAVKAAGGLAPVLSAQARSVAIKTNIVQVKESGDGTITDWRVVWAVVQLVHEIAPGAIVKVIEAANWDAPDSAPRRRVGAVSGCA